MTFTRLLLSRPVMLGLLAWTGGWTGISLAQGLSLANQAVLLVLTSAVSALWWRPVPVVAASALSVLAFDLLFIPPKGHLTIDLRQDAILLVTMLSVSTTIALLMGKLRALAAAATRNALRSEQLHALAEHMRVEADPATMAAICARALSALFEQACFVRLADGTLAPTGAPPSRNEVDALALAARDGHELGPGTQRYESFPGWVVPVRGAGAVLGAAMVRLDSGAATKLDLRSHARAICSLTGTAIERRHAQSLADTARMSEKIQSERNALLAAIAHDHRTPLATILGAASAQVEQHARLAPEQQLALSRTIVDETEQLIRLTENTLQLARLDNGRVQLHSDWQSAEELLGNAVQRARRRFPLADVRIHVPAGLPLFKADGILLVQLFDNLLNNAIEHAGAPGPIEASAGVVGQEMVFRIADRGSGIDPALRQHIFEPYFRAGAYRAQRGAGLGLAVCKAIAQAHHGDIRCEAREGTGCVFSVNLPLPERQLDIPEDPK